MGVKICSRIPAEYLLGIKQQFVILHIQSLVIDHFTYLIFPQWGMHQIPAKLHLK